jgi:hypothetical protein
LKEGVSVAELIRRSVDRVISGMEGDFRNNLKERARKVTGKYRTAADNLAADHDRHLAEDLDK